MGFGETIFDLNRTSYHDGLSTIFTLSETSTYKETKWHSEEILISLRQQLFRWMEIFYHWIPVDVGARCTSFWHQNCLSLVFAVCMQWICLLLMKNSSICKWYDDQTSEKWKVSKSTRIDQLTFFEELSYHLWSMVDGNSQILNPKAEMNRLQSQTGAKFVNFAISFSLAKFGAFATFYPPHRVQTHSSFFTRIFCKIFDQKKGIQIGAIAWLRCVVQINGTGTVPMNDTPCLCECVHYSMGACMSVYYRSILIPRYTNVRVNPIRDTDCTQFYCIHCKHTQEEKSP